jgi:transcriptional regulator with XRE-family HTH domain
MRAVRRPPAVVTGVREGQAIAANLGRDTRTTRRRRRLTQAELGDRVGLGQSEISYLERGRGARTSIETWVAIGIALGRPIAIGFSRDAVDPLPHEAGHLGAQELVLRLATSGGWRGRFEAPSRPLDPTHSTDVRLERDGGVVGLIEIWNRLDDLGAAVRSSDRKLADVAIAGSAAVASCWLLADTAANQAIVHRYPRIFRARFGGSSARWILAITSGTPGPLQPGIAWIDVRSGTLRELRLRAMVPPGSLR